MLKSARLPATAVFLVSFLIRQIRSNKPKLYAKFGFSARNCRHEGITCHTSGIEDGPKRDFRGYRVNNYNFDTDFTLR